MNFGLMFPNKGRPYGSADVLIELANLAEASGWEGFFLEEIFTSRGTLKQIQKRIAAGPPR